MLNFFVITGLLFIAGLWIGAIIVDSYWSKKHAAYKSYSARCKRMAREFDRGFAAGQNAMYNDFYTRMKEWKAEKE